MTIEIDMYIKSGCFIKTYQFLLSNYCAQTNYRYITFILNFYV